MNFTKTLTAFILLVLSNVSYADNKPTLADSFLSKLQTPGSQRLETSKTLDELAIEQEIEKQQKQAYREFLQNDQMQYFIAQQVSSSKATAQEANNIYSMLLVLQAAQKAPGNKEVVDAGFIPFQKLQKFFEDQRLQNQIEKQKIIEAEELHLEEMKELQSRKENRERHLKSNKWNLVKALAANDEKKAQHEKEMYRIYQERQAAKLQKNQPRS